jgi:hypothetical protein
VWVCYRSGFWSRVDAMRFLLCLLVQRQVVGAPQVRHAACGLGSTASGSGSQDLSGPEHDAVFCRQSIPFATPAILDNDSKVEGKPSCMFRLPGAPGKVVSKGASGLRFRKVGGDYA